jgi:type II secretory pathway pseudopilin PulG
MKDIRLVPYIGRDSQGFTIIEALISILIVSFALIGIFRIHLQAVKSTELNRRTLSAVQFANSGVEQLRSEKYANVTTTTEPEKSTVAVDFTDPDLQFLREVTVSTVGGIQGTKKILVQVGWDTISPANGDVCTGALMTGCEYNLTLETYLTDFN